MWEARDDPLDACDSPQGYKVGLAHGGILVYPGGPTPNQNWDNGKDPAALSVPQKACITACLASNG